MKTILAATFLFLSSFAQAQVPAAAELNFDQKVAHCENLWFGAKRTDGKVVLGYVYIDPTAGFTFEHYGYLESSGGALRAIKSELHDKARVIERIHANFPASCLTEARAATLGLPSAPKSMEFYKDDRPLGEHHTSWAYHYNHIGASDIALDHVSKALAAGASSTSLSFEHAFALNVLERFDETIAVLTPVLVPGSKTADLIAELAYAYLMKGEHQKSIDLYTQAIEFNGNKPAQRRWEFARNISAAYGRLGDSRQRDKWMKLSIRYKRQDDKVLVE